MASSFEPQDSPEISGDHPHLADGKRESGNTWGSGETGEEERETDKNQGRGEGGQGHCSLFFLLNKDWRQRELSLTLAASCQLDPLERMREGQGFHLQDCRPLGGISGILLLAGQVPYVWRS